jgi:hypothetical protein
MEGTHREALSASSVRFGRCQLKLADWHLMLNTSDHITDALICVHSLRASERIKYTVAVLTYKVIYGFAPRYLGTFDRIADLPGRQRLRSTETHCLQVPPYRLSTVGSRAFPVAGART